jgi:hypothetical protein
MHLDKRYLFVCLAIAVFIAAIFTFQNYRRSQKIAQTKQALELIRESLSAKSEQLDRLCSSVKPLMHENVNLPLIKKIGSGKDTRFEETRPAEIVDHRKFRPWPSLASLRANNVVSGGDCNPMEVVGERAARILQEHKEFLENPSGESASNVINSCMMGGCDRSLNFNCAGNPFNSTDVGWCYDESTGEFWSNVEETNSL